MKNLQIADGIEGIVNINKQLICETWIEGKQTKQPCKGS